LRCEITPRAARRKRGRERGRSHFIGISTAVTLHRHGSPSPPFDPILTSSHVDNAAMIAWAAMHRFLARDHDDVSIEIQPKWNIEDLAG
jgi:hypothetical protein